MILWRHLFLLLELQVSSLSFVLPRPLASGPGNTLPLHPTAHKNAVTAVTRSSSSMTITTKAMKQSNDAKQQQQQQREQKSSRGIPKAETGILTLQSQYPDGSADGRGIRIAVLDTGCDLSAAGLQTTSDGKPKYLDFIDGTGDGDVDMRQRASVVVTDDDGADGGRRFVVKGLSGRDLILPGAWAASEDEDDKGDGDTDWRLGAVRLYHLLPSSVERRLKRERKEIFMSRHVELTSQTQRSIDELRSAKNSTSASSKADEKVEKEKDNKKKIKEMELLLEQLKEMASSYDDPGPLLDIISFKSPKDNLWKAVIDTTGTGNLTTLTPMSQYAHARETGQLGFGSEVTYCLQFYDGGDTLSVVTDAGSHGTHVAGITAAHFSPTTSSSSSGATTKGGVAPGAQIVAIKIGDGRLSSTETGCGLIRALAAAKKYGCHLVNLSYGEPSWQPDTGRVSEVFADAVFRWNMAVFTSAGNDGPALSSLGSPGTLTAPITVGAYVSKEMMTDQYSSLPPSDDADPDDEEDGGYDDDSDGDGSKAFELETEAQEGASYYFSSRGPSPDGYFPDLCAPGGAIAPIPRHALQGKAQYHGTSMASPNACGVAACVLSALLQQQKEDSSGSTDSKSAGVVSPVALKRAFINTAIAVKPVSDSFAEGAGLINAVKAVEYLKKHGGKMGENVHFGVSIPSRNNARGIYLRDAVQLSGPLTFGVLIKPRFDHAVVRSEKEMTELLDLELDLELRPSEKWVTCPERMTLLSALERGGQSFNVRLDTSGLSPGAHFATVSGIDASDPDRGALFQVPITVIVPHTQNLSTSAKLNSNSDSNGKKSNTSDESVTLLENGIDLSMTYKLNPGAANRRFLTVPSQAEWATIKITPVNPLPSPTSPQRLLLHVIPFVRGDLPNTEIQLKKLVPLTEGIEHKYHLRVKGESTMEVCLQSLWLANPTPTTVSVTVEYHSLSINQASTLVSSQVVRIGSAKEFARLGATAVLRSEHIEPKATLTSVARTLRPATYAITAGSEERDLMPPSDATATSRDDAGRQGQLIYDMALSYKFKVEAEKAVAVTPSIPSLFHQLYDSPLDSQLWVLKDANSQVLTYGSSMHSASPTTLSKGDYSLTLLLRHVDRNVLEQMKDVPCQLSFNLTDPLSCAVYSQLDKASTPAVTGDGRNPVGKKLLKRGDYLDLYVARPTADLPAWVTPGDILTGDFILDNSHGDVTKTRLVYDVPPKPNKNKAHDDDDKGNDDDEEEESLEDAVFQSKIAFLTKLRSKLPDKRTEYETLAAELEKEKPESIPLLQERLAYCEKAPSSSKDGTTGDDDDKDESARRRQGDEHEWRTAQLEELGQKLLKQNGGPVDELVLAQYFGVNPPAADELKDDKDARALKKEMDNQKKLLKSVLLAKAASLGQLLASFDNKDDDGANVSIPPEMIKNFDEAVTQMKKYISSADHVSETLDKIATSLVLARHAHYCQKKSVTAVSILRKARNDPAVAMSKGYKDLTNDLLRIYRSVGCDYYGGEEEEGTKRMDYLVEVEKNALLAKFPVVQQRQLVL